MKNKLTRTLIGAITAILYCINLVLWVTTLYVVGSLKWLIPYRRFQEWDTNAMHVLLQYWTKSNAFITRHTSNIIWDVQGLENLNMSDWYLIVANHQSWTDILVLQSIFDGKIPPLKFFLKKELLWTLPFASWACWLLDFPLMTRLSKKKLAKHPELKGQDIITTRKACEKFKNRPTTVAIFIESTRFTREKQARQTSPYQHLLRPKAGGIAFALATLGDFFHKILDVTIVYPKTKPTIWQFFCGEIPTIIVRVKTLPIDQTLLGDYENDREFRKRFQHWLNQLWQQKDKTITEIFRE